jgi:hypothetical protein
MIRRPVRLPSWQGTDPSSRTATFHRFRYPDSYAWYALVSATDIAATAFVIEHFNAREVNAVANVALGAGGLWGLVALKAVTIAFVVLICEYVGRHKEAVGHHLAEAAVVISALPVIATLAQLAVAFAEPL